MACSAGVVGPSSGRRGPLTSSRVENTPLVTRLQSEAELVSSSGGDTLLQGSQVRANGGYAINAGVGDKAWANARIILEETDDEKPHQALLCTTSLLPVRGLGRVCRGSNDL
jgi:hypothetical protein